MAAASVARLHPGRELELHHIYDSRILVIDNADWHRICGVPLTSYAQVSQGLDCQDSP